MTRSDQMELRSPVGGAVGWRFPAVCGDFGATGSLPSEPGWKFVTTPPTLARRGSSKVLWPGREMLDENQQLRNHGARLPDGKYAYDEVAAREFTIVALKAIAAWHEKQAQGNRSVAPKLQEIDTRVDELAQSPHLALKMQAEKTRATFFR